MSKELGTFHYDVTDIQRLIETGEVTERDVDDVEKVFESEFVASVELGRKIIETVATQLTPETDANQIFEILIQQPDFKKRAEQAKEIFQLFAEKIYESSDKSSGAMLNIGMELFKVEEKNNQKREEIRRVRESVADAQRLKQIREKLKT